MSLVDVARRVVLGTNRWPGLKTLYDQAYDLALTFTVNRLSSVPGVLAVMLRANDDGRAWVPGLSDYDLTVLTDRHDALEAIAFLDDVWARYRSIKRIVPQLGEMEVMDVEGYRDLLDFGPMPTASLKAAYPLFVRGGDVEPVLQHARRPSRPHDFLLDALSRFGRFSVPAWLDDASHGNRVTRRRAEHLLDNVDKRLARLGVEAGASGTGTLADRMVTVFRSLSSACQRAGPREPGAAAAIDPHVSSIAIDELSAIRKFCEDIVRHARLPRCSAVVWRSYMSVDRSHLVFIVPDDAPDEEITRLFVTLGLLDRRFEGLLTGEPVPRAEKRRRRAAFSFVASESMWRCWLDLSPFDGVAVAATGRTVIGPNGRDPVWPSLSALRRGAAVQYASLLPLKNNWRQSNGREPGRSYGPLVNHAKGYASAFAGPVLTAPAELEFGTTEAGYLAAFAALKELRAHLRAERARPG